MRTIILLIIIFTFKLNDLGFSQTSEIVKINALLDNTTYYDIKLNYKMNIILPDSVKQKFIAALKGEVPQKLADTLLFVSIKDRDLIWKHYKNSQECKGDSACATEKCNAVFQKEYARKYKMLYDYYKVSNTVVLAAGSWNIHEAIPVLEKAIGDTKYDQQSVLMALAKLGNDSIYQALKESHTLSYLLKHTELDTTNDKATYGYEDNEIIQGAYYNYNNMANYFKDKDFLYYMVDLLYIRGIIPAFDYYISSTERTLLSDFPSLFNDSKNSKIWDQMCWNYYYKYRDAQKKRNKKESKLILSSSYKRQVISELKEWIDKNVNFE
jgi:hypothetical protein